MHARVYGRVDERANNHWRYCRQCVHDALRHCTHFSLFNSCHGCEASAAPTGKWFPFVSVICIAFDIFSIKAKSISNKMRHQCVFRSSILWDLFRLRLESRAIHSGPDFITIIYPLSQRNRKQKTLVYKFGKKSANGHIFFRRVIVSVPARLFHSVWMNRVEPIVYHSIVPGMCLSRASRFAPVRLCRNHNQIIIHIWSHVSGKHSNLNFNFSNALTFLFSSQSLTLSLVPLLSQWDLPECEERLPFGAQSQMKANKEWELEQVKHFLAFHRILKMEFQAIRGSAHKEPIQLEIIGLRNFDLHSNKVARGASRNRWFSETVIIRRQKSSINSRVWVVNLLLYQPLMIQFDFLVARAVSHARAPVRTAPNQTVARKTSFYLLIKSLLRQTESESIERRCSAHPSITIKCLKFNLFINRLFIKPHFAAFATE